MYYSNIMSDENSDGYSVKFLSFTQSTLKLNIPPALDLRLVNKAIYLITWQLIFKICNYLCSFVFSDPDLFTKKVYPGLPGFLFRSRGFAHYFYWLLLFRGTQRQFSENICSEDDLRSRIFGTFIVKSLACLPLLGFSNIYKMV